MIINLDEKKIVSIKYKNDNGTYSFFNFEDGVLTYTETIDKEPSKNIKDNTNDKNACLDKATYNILSRSKDLSLKTLYSKDELKKIGTKKDKYGKNEYKPTSEAIVDFANSVKSEELLKQCPKIKSKTSGYTINEDGGVEI